MDEQLGLFPDEPQPPASPPVEAAEVSYRVTRLASSLPKSLRMGTSSWSFPGWNGIVYDRRASQATLARHGLSAYGAHPLFRTVGLDRTYYRSIGTEDYRAYADAVPDDFRFLVKADRLLTSPLSPEDSSVRRANPYFLDAQYAVEHVVAPVTEGLGEKAGPVLFQFSPIPPNLVGGRDAFIDRLNAFLEALPVGLLYAIELRTPAFLTETYAQMLRETGATHCYSVHPAMASLARQLSLVSPFHQPALVVRWMLHSGLKYNAAKDRYAPFDQIVDEDSISRDRIATAVIDALIAEREAFVIANNKAEGSAPHSILRLAEHIASWSSSSFEGGADAS
jgi:uncharacterized protein YecE (DUF72 family)